MKGWRAHGEGTLENSKNNYKITGTWENSKIKKAIINFYADQNISSVQIIDFSKRIGNINYRDDRYY